MTTYTRIREIHMKQKLLCEIFICVEIIIFIVWYLYFQFTAQSRKDKIDNCVCMLPLGIIISAHLIPTTSLASIQDQIFDVFFKDYVNTMNTIPEGIHLWKSISNATVKVSSFLFSFSKKIHVI